MPELPPVDPPERGHSEESSALSGLIKASATIGVLAAAAGGSRILLKHLPPSIKIAAQQKLARWGLASVKRLQKHPTFTSALNRAFSEHPSHNDLFLERQLSEVSVGELGLLHAMETISRLQAPDLMMQKNIHKNLLLKYDMEIPQLRDGAWRRMTLQDMWDSITAGRIKLPDSELTNRVRPHEVARKLGMSVSDLKGLRLDPYMMFNEKTGQVANLNNMNLLGRAIDWAEDVRLMGVPIFKLRPDKRGDHLGMALFGRNSAGPDDPPHPLVKYLTNQDKGQLFVLDREVYHRKSAVEPFKLLDGVSGNFVLTSDYKAAELGLRAHGTTAQYDELMYGLGKTTGLRQKFGFGPEFMPKGQASLLGSLGRWNVQELQEQKGFIGWLKRKVAQHDPMGIVTGRPSDVPKGFGSPASVLTKPGAEAPGQLYLRRGGLAGIGDWLNVQAARPFYLLNQFGVGLRPGKNFISTMGKISALAAGAYMAKEALSYADWATGNVVSTAAGKALGLLHMGRQQALESAGVTGALTGLEEELPGLTSGSLSNILRFGGLMFAGAALGKSIGGKKWMKNLLANVARGKGPAGLGRFVARNMISNIGLTSASGSVAGLVVGAGAATTVAGDLRRSPDEIGQELRGERQVPYRASAGWMLGRDPFGGGRIRFYRPSAYQSAGVDYEAIGVYGSEGNKWRFGSWLPTVQNWGGLRRLVNPYFAEERNYLTRPYPVTSGHFGDYPIFGPMLQSTVGSVLKPARYRTDGFGIEMQSMQAASMPGMASMNAAVQAAAGSTLGYYTGNVGGFGGASPAQIANMGYGVAGLETSGVSAPGGVTNAFANLSRNIQEYSGLRGFQIQFLTEMLTGTPTPGLDRAVLAGSGSMSSVSRSYYGSEPGGLLGTTELLRRFLVRPSGQPEVNPIPNALPRWLPGSLSMFEGDRRHYADFSRGDPYTKIPLGEARLPGPGRDALYAKHGGAAYDVVDSFLVLSDVAPFTDAYRIMKTEVERLIRQGKLDPEWVNRYSIAVSQAEQRAQSRVFHSSRYRDRQTLTISEVLGPTKFRTQQMPGVTFNLEGTQLDYSEPIGLIAERQGRGLSAAQAHASVLADKSALRGELEGLVGKGIEIDITGMKAGKVTARIPQLESVINRMGVGEEDTLRDQSVFGQAYTGAGKLIGEAGFLGGLAYGIARGGKSPIAKVIGALTPAAISGVVGGWVENKFTGDFSALEHYKRFQVYGSGFADWTKPYSAFIRPWVNSAASTVMDYTPPHRQDQYEIEEYFDKLKYIKYKQLARQADRTGESNLTYEFEELAKSTLTGLDYNNLSATTPGLYDALPANERQYFRQFSAEQDPSVRKEIVDSVPDYMKSVYLSIWHNNDKGLGSDGLGKSYDKYVAPLLNTSPDQRIAKYFSGGRAVPAKDWMGWHPAANLADIKYRTIQITGGNPHDHGLFSSQERNIHAYTPWLNEPAEDVAPMVEPGLNVGGLRKLWGRIAADGVVNVVPNFDGRKKADLRLFADDSDRYEDYYTQMAAGNIGIY